MTSTMPHAAELDGMLTSVGTPDDADWMAMLDLVTATVGFEEPGVCEDLGNVHVWKYQVQNALVSA